MSEKNQTTPESLANELKIPSHKKAGFSSHSSWWSRLYVNPIESLLMMSRLRIGILMGVLLLIIAVYSTWWVTTRPLFQLFFPPRDLYVPLVQMPIDLSQLGATYQFQTSHKYRGLHSLGIYFNDSKPIDFERHYHWSLQVQLAVSSRGRVLVTKNLSKSEGPFWAKERSGFILWFYEVPDDLPVNKTLTFSIRVTTPDTTLASRYGAPYFYIEKESDE